METVQPSPFAHKGGNPSLQVRLIQGDTDPFGGESDLELNALLVEALKEAGYDAASTEVPGSHIFSSRHGSLEVIVEVIMEVARD